MSEIALERYRGGGRGGWPGWGSPRLPFLASCVLLALGALALPAPAAAAFASWYNPSWAYRKALTLNGALVQGTQTNFPVLVALNDPDSHLRANAQASGNDILFTAVDGITKLAHEIERYDATTGALVAWVKVPTLTNGTNTAIFMYYGNAAAGNQQQPTLVWDTDYKAVWHLAEPGAAPAAYLDSTSNPNDGTSTSHPAPLTSGIIGPARDFNGAGNLIAVATSASLQLTTSLTLEGWIRMDGFRNFCCDISPIVREGVTNPNDYQLSVRAYTPDTTAAGPGHVGFSIEQDDDTGLDALNVIAGTGIPYHVVATWDGATKRIYLNGAQVALGAYATAITPDGSGVYLGGRPFEDYHDGLLDEVRISSVDRSATWIQTEYNNMANQGVGAGKFILNATTEGASARLKLVQSGTVTIPPADPDATVTATLNPAVDMAKSFLVFGATSATGDSPDDLQVSGQITATNTVTFRRSSTVSPDAVAIQWYVAEFASGVSVQRGSANLIACGINCNVTLPTAVNTGRAFALISQRKQGFDFDDDDFVRAQITGPTTLSLNVPRVTGAPNVIEWQVVEHEAASVQRGTVSFAFNETSKAVTLPTPASTSKSWLLYTYSCGPANDCQTTDNGSKLVRGRLTSGTTLTFDRSRPSPTAIDVIDLNWQLVSFSDATWVQHGNQSFAAGGATAVDVTLSQSVSPAASIATAGGYTRGGRSALNDLGLPVEGWFNLQLDKPKNLRISRGGNAFAADVGWFVVTFPRYESYAAPALGPLGPGGCPAGTFRSTTNLIPNGSFATSGGGPAAQPLAASQFTVDPRQTGACGGGCPPAWGWAGDNVRPNDTQFMMASGAWCYSFTGPSLTCLVDDVTRQGAFPGDPGFGLQPTACALAGNPSTPAYNPDYPGCWLYGNGNSYATDYKIWETRSTVSLTAGKTYTFVAYASDVITPGWAATPPALLVKKGPTPCTTNAGTLAAMCGGTAPTALHPSAFAVPKENVDTTEAFNPGEIWTRYQVTFSAAVAENAYFSIWDPTQTTGGVDMALAQVGLYECALPTAVTLSSFTAAGSDGAVDLSWTTGSELDNLGFHLHRALSAEGPYERITPALIPGLGSSPFGQGYSYRDAGLANGTTYYYKLEDVDTSGVSTLHGPVSAAPTAASGTEEDGSGSSSGNGGSAPSSLTAHGDPSASSLTVLEHDAQHALLELRTGGFYTRPRSDGTVEVQIPGFESTARPGAPDLPTRSTWIDAIAGRRVILTSVLAQDTVSFSDLRPAPAGAPSIAVSRDGMIVRPTRQRRAADPAFLRGTYPRVSARLLGTGFQQETKKAHLELAPLRFSASSGQLLLARRLLVRLDFTGKDSAEISLGGSRGRRPVVGPRPSPGAVQLLAKDKGLYRVSFEDLFAGGRPLPVQKLRLSRQGVPVPFHVDRPVFGPGASLYFVSDGAFLNPNADHAIYELTQAAGGVGMATAPAAPAGPAASFAFKRVTWEQNKTYQAGLLDAPDLWLWEVLVSPVTKSYPFSIDLLAPASEPARLSVDLQGASDFEADPDHHVRISVNGVLVGETTWDGKLPRTVEAEVTPGLLVDGANTLQVENVGDTAASYSMILLSRFSLSYPRLLSASGGVFEGTVSETGTGILEVSGLASDSLVVDTTTAPQWLTGATTSAGGLSFRAEAGHRYLAVSPEAVLRPEVRRPSTTRLRAPQNGADYLLLAPREFLPAAEPLILLRQGQGLRTRTIPLEDVYDQFGFGEEGPAAVKAFLSHAYHSWQKPSPRYVLLLGDATYDPKDFTKTGTKDRLPTPLTRTSFLWTASDPSYAQVNGDDLLPDLAIGRLPAANLAEAQVMIDKILAFEQAHRDLSGRAVLVADNEDQGGPFEKNSDEIAALLHERPVDKLYLRDLGAQGLDLRTAIRNALDDGASLLSYVGHGSIAVWASENVWNNLDVNTLQPQPQQPLVLTFDCLNGFFHFPPLNSLTEQMVKAEGKGALAAVSPSGLSLDEPAHVFHKALLGQLLSGHHDRLGDALLAAQSDYATTGAFPELLAIYHLFGDPATRIR